MCGIFFRASLSCTNCNLYASQPNSIILFFVGPNDGVIIGAHRENTRRMSV
jgi:hypothetical protein